MNAFADVASRGIIEGKLVFHDISLRSVERKMADRLRHLLPEEASHRSLTDLMAITMGCPGVKEECLRKFFDMLDLRVETLCEIVGEIMEVKEAMDSGM